MYWLLWHHMWVFWVPNTVILFINVSTKLKMDFIRKDDFFWQNCAVSRWLQFITFIHTYLHNWSLQPFSQVYDQASHITYVVCVNFIYEWRNLQFKVDTEQQIIEKLFNRNFLYSQRNLLRESWARNILIFFFWCQSWDLKAGLTSNKPTHYILDYGGVHCIQWR